MALFGNTLDAELEKIDGKNQAEITGKRERLLAKWIPDQKNEARNQKFRDPGKGTKG